MKRPRSAIEPMLAARAKRRAMFPEKERAMSIANLPKDCSGKKNGNWKGGVTSKSRGLRWSKEYQRWRKLCLKRDGHKCKLCGARHKISVHHIIAMSQCLEIATLPMNGVTLCYDCHYQNDAAWKGERYSNNSIGKSLSLIFSVPHKFHTYPTCGNWQFTESGTTVIFVSGELPQLSQDLVYIHELAEARMCAANGITQKQVDDFDMNYEATRKDGDDSEPGDHPEAPYFRQHQIATITERMFALEMGVNWEEHEAAIDKLFGEP